MSFTVTLTKRAEKEYGKLSEKDKERVLLALLRLRTEAFAGKQLNGEHDGYWSVRVWPYRIIYTINKQIVTVTVVAIGQRKDVYRMISR